VKTPEQAHRHGTAMASAIAAHGKMLGIAPAASLLAAHAFDPAAAVARSTTMRLLDSLQWCVDNGARIVNMSFAGPADPRLHDMLIAARRRDVVLIAAAGNNGPSAPPAYPASYPEVIAVTATDANDGLFAQANRGPYVAVAAPGVDILVAAPGAGYDMTTGTSVAAAHVSGLAALLLEQQPRLTPDALTAVLLRSARDLGIAGRDVDYGAGLVSALEALNALAPQTAAHTVR
jgi:subtilisin family serine protease